jgi:hypothetical protein
VFLARAGPFFASHGGIWVLAPATLRRIHATLRKPLNDEVISHRLRHSSPHFTAKFYGDVLPELSHNAAEAAAALVPGHQQSKIKYP